MEWLHTNVLKVTALVLYIQFTSYKYVEMMGSSVCGAIWYFLYIIMVSMVFITSQSTTEQNFLRIGYIQMC